MTRDELRVHIWERFCIVMPEVADPIQQADAIMALVDTYSVGVVLEFHHARVDGAYVQVTEQEALEWLKARK